MDYDSDEEIYEKIKEKLEVHSFGEFLEKFQPTVYEYTTGSEGGLPQMHYTIDPKEASRCKTVTMKC
ncbi:MAG: hypothetical protein K6G55_06580 [Selenomonadaceae bacterium]|nr:hypothetical protein [Selenomonadaceae bacterium]